jgi:hypothetical protein
MKKDILDYRRGRFSNAIELDYAAELGDPNLNPKTGEPWTFLEKLLGVADQSVNIVNKAKAGTVTLTKGPISAKLGSQALPPPPQATFLGMPKTLGIIVAVGVVGVIGFAIWKMNK